MDKLYIVIPAYNEQDNIEDVVKDWYPVVEQRGADSRLVIIDDGSKDATYAKLLELAKDRPQLEPLHKENGGHGATILFGYQYAIDQGADYIFQTDSDGQTLPEEFDAFWEKRADYDMVIGHRKGRQDGFSRVVVTKVLKENIINDKTIFPRPLPHHIQHPPDYPFDEDFETAVLRHSNNRKWYTIVMRCPAGSSASKATRSST